MAVATADIIGADMVLGVRIVLAGVSIDMVASLSPPTWSPPVNLIPSTHRVGNVSNVFNVSLPY